VKSHIVIAGPGRAGTTLLVKLFDSLGFETRANELTFYEAAQAGLEADLLAEDPPHVVKDPDLTVNLPRMLATGDLKPERVEWMVIPLRELSDAAASRVLITARERKLYSAGGLVWTKRPARQRQALAEGTYGLFLTAARYELPLLLLEYPRFATEPGYAYRTLRPLLGDRDERSFAEAWRQVVDPALVRDQPIERPPLVDARIAWVRFRRWVKRWTSPASVDT
jgi:hypothetical protein